MKLFPKQPLFYDESAVVLSEYRSLVAPEAALMALKSIETRRYFFMDNTPFIKTSLKYNKTDGKHAPRASIGYYSEYSSLDHAERKWYFYWRKMALNGEIYSDPFCLDIFVEELVNYSFNPSGAFNVSMLIRLYMSYSQDYDVENLRLVISDMLIEMGAQELADKWYFASYISESNLSSELSMGTELSKISINAWKEFVTNKRKSAFFKENRNQVYKTFKECLFLLDEYYQANSLDMMQVFFKEKQEKELSPLFPNVPILRRTGTRTYDLKVVEPTSRSYTDISVFYRLAENVTRLLKGENRLLPIKDNPFPQSLTDDMLRYMENLASNKRFKKVKAGSNQQGSSIPNAEERIPVEVVFDDERIKRLQKENEELVLAVEKRSGTDEHVAKEKIKIVAPIKENIVVERSFFSEAVELDESILIEFVATLNTAEQQLIASFKELSLKKADAEKIAKKHGQMLSMLLTDLNEKSIELLDDNLVEEHEDYLELYEEFASIVAKVKEELT